MLNHQRVDFRQQTSNKLPKWTRNPHPKPPWKPRVQAAAAARTSISWTRSASLHRPVASSPWTPTPRHSRSRWSHCPGHRGSRCRGWPSRSPSMRTKPLGTGVKTWQATFGRFWEVTQRQNISMNMSFWNRIDDIKPCKRTYTDQDICIKGFLWDDVRSILLSGVEWSIVELWRSVFPMYEMETQLERFRA